MNESIGHPCDHWSECYVNGGGCCALNLYGGKPTYGVCKICPTNTTGGVWPDMVQLSIQKRLYRQQYRQSGGPGCCG